MGVSTLDPTTCVGRGVVRIEASFQMGYLHPKSKILGVYINYQIKHALYLILGAVVFKAGGNESNLPCKKLHFGCFL